MDNLRIRSEAIRIPCSTSLSFGSVHSNRVPQINSTDISHSEMDQQDSILMHCQELLLESEVKGGTFPRRHRSKEGTTQQQSQLRKARRLRKSGRLKPKE